MMINDRLMRTSLALAAVCAMLVFASSAAAQFGIAGFDGSVSNKDGSADTQAGSHPFAASTTIDFNTLNAEGHVLPDEHVKDIKVDLPAGFVGDPTAMPKCDDEALVSENCPVASQVGVVTLRVFFGINSEFTEPVFNMVAPASEPAQFAFILLSHLVHINANLRSEGDYGLRVDIPDISEAVPVISSKLTFWGVPADPSHDEQRGTHFDCYGDPSVPANCGGGGNPSPVLPKPFLTNPTDCSAGPLTTTLQVDSWEHPGEYRTANFVSHDNGTPPNAIGVTGCGLLAFEPTITMRPDLAAAGAPTGYSFDLHVPQNDSIRGLSEAEPRDVSVTLPLGTAVSPSAAAGLGACSVTQVGIGGTGPASCPESSKIGTVEIDTPLLEGPLKGAVYLAEQGANPFDSLLALYLVAEGQGVTVRLAGRVSPDPVTGQLTVSFEENPQLPFSDLKLDLEGGPRAPLSNPSTCGPATTSSQMTSYSGETAAPSDTFTVSADGDGGACPAAPPFAPSFEAGTVSPQAGGFSPFTLTLSRSDAEQTLGAVSVRMPPGLLGVLKSAVQCPEPEASQGTCATGSLIGHTTVAAGAGSNPFYLGGSVYLTGPYKGAPFGLSIVVPALAGPFNLGTVVVRAAIAVDPRTTALTITSDPLPSILQGIPLQIRTVNVTVDRTGFMFNPTDCAPLSVNGTVTSTQGASAPLASHFQAVNCATLAFRPKFSASVAGRSSRASGAALDVKISSGAGQANIGRVAVSLPRVLPSRLKTIQKACLAATFAADPASCPVGSLVGTGTAVTPILARPLSGPAYLVSHGGAAFPDLVVVLKGEGITVDLTGAIDITKAGITSSTFANVPDVPISSFELKLPTGPHSALAANLPAKAKGSLCGQTLTMPTSITGQNGALVKQSTKLTVTGCASAKKAAGAKESRDAVR